MKYLALLGIILSGIFLTGCGGTLSGGDKKGNPPPTTLTNLPPDVDILSAGDKVKVDFSNVPTLIPPHEEQIKEDGTIELPLIGSIKAAGKSIGQLQRQIQDAYVPKYYVRMTVTVTPADRFYYVGGEVKSPNRFPYAGGITVIRAIQSAGDFTDFAKRKNVQLIRANGKIEYIDANKARKNPKLDVPIYPGDTIHVDRGF